MTNEQMLSDLYQRIAKLERIVTPFDIPVWPSTDQPCLFDSVRNGENVAMGLACSCPRCSAR